MAQGVECAVVCAPRVDVLVGTHPTCTTWEAQRGAVQPTPLRAAVGSVGVGTTGTGTALSILVSLVDLHADAMATLPASLALYRSLWLRVRVRARLWAGTWEGWSPTGARRSTRSGGNRVTSHRATAASGVHRGIGSRLLCFVCCCTEHNIT